MEQEKKAVKQSDNAVKKSNKIYLLIAASAALFVMFFAMTGYVYVNEEVTQKVRGYVSERHDAEAVFDVAYKDYIIRNEHKYRVVNGNENVTLVSYDEDFDVTNHETYESTKYQIENHLVREDEISTQSESIPYVDGNNYFLYDEKTNHAINLTEIVIDEEKIPADSLLLVDSENATIEYSYAAIRGSGMSTEPVSGEFGPESLMVLGESSTTLSEFFGLPINEDEDEMPDVDYTLEDENPDEPSTEATTTSPDLEVDADADDADKNNNEVIDLNPGDSDSDTDSDSDSDTDADADSNPDEPTPAPIDPVKPTLKIESLAVDKNRYYPGEDVEVTIQLDNPSKLAIEEISINGKAYTAGELEVSADKSVISKTITAPDVTKLQADVATLDYVKYNNGVETVKLDSGEIVKADVLFDVPELTDVTLDKSTYNPGEPAVAMLSFTNTNNAEISSVKVDGATEKFTEISNSDGTTTGTIELTAPITVGVDQPIGTIEEFTFDNGVVSEDVDTTDKPIEEDVVYVTPVLEDQITFNKSTYNPGETITATLTFTNENNAPISSVTIDGVEKPFTPTTAGDYTTGTVELKAPQTAGTLTTIGTIEGFTFDNGIDQAKYVEITNILIKANVLAKTPVLTGFELDKKVYEANSTVIAELTFTNENNAPISSVKVNGEDKTFTPKSNEDGATTGTIELTAPTNVGVDQLIGTIEGFTFDNGVNQTEYFDITTDLPIAEDVVHEPVVVTNVAYEVGPYRISDDVEATITFDNPTGATIETVVVGETSEQVTGQVDDSASGTSEGTITLTAPTTVGTSQLIGEVTGVTYHDGINSGASGTVDMPDPTVRVNVKHDPVVLTGVSYEDIPYTPAQDVAVELTFDNPTGATIENVGVDNGTSVNQEQLLNQQNDSTAGTSTGTIYLTAPSLIDADQLIGTVTEVTYHDGINPGVSGTVTAISPAVTVDVIHEAVVLTGINYVPGPHMPSESVEVELTFSNPTGATIGNIGVNDGTTSVSMALENQQNNTDGTSTGSIYLTAPDFVVAGHQIGTVESFTYDHDNDIATAEIAGTLNVTDPNIVVNVTGEPISVVSVTIEDEDDDTDARFYPGEDITVTITLNNPDDLQIEKIKINGTVYNAGDFTVAPDVDDTTVITKVITAAPQPIADYQVVLDSVTYDKYNNDAETIEVTSGATQVADVLFEIPSLSGTVTLDNSPYYPGDTATATLTFTNPNNAPITSVNVGGEEKVFTPLTAGDNTTGTIQFTVPQDIGALKTIGTIEDFTFNNGVAEENSDITDIAIQSNVVHKPVEVTDVTYEDVPYYPSDDVVVTLVVSNPTGATIEEIEITTAGAPTWYAFTPVTNDSANKTTTGTITLTAPGVGTGQTIGEVTGVKYHDGINTGALGTVGVTSTDAQVTLNVVHEPVVLTNVAYTEGPYTLGESVDITLTFENPTGADIETVTVGGTPVAVTGQVDNGDETSTGIITITPTVVDLDQDLGTIEGFTYDDDDDSLTTGVVGTITATNLDIIADVVHVPPTLTVVTYENVQYTLGESVDVELTFDNPTEADIESVTVGGTSIPVADADQTDDGFGTTTVIITLTPTTIGLNQDQGTITEFTYDNDEDDLTAGTVGAITATNQDVIVDVVHIKPTLTDVTFTEREYTLGESVEVELTFTNPTEADIETVTVGGNSVQVADTDQTNDGSGTTTVIVTLTPSTVSLDQDLGTITEFTYNNDDDDLTTGVVGAITATNLDIIVDVIHVVPTLTAVSYNPGPYAKSSAVTVELEINNPTKAKIEDVEATISGTPTLYQFTETGYDDVTKTTTGTIDLTASGLGISQLIGTITGFTYNHDEDVTTAGIAGTISTSLLPTDLEIKVDITGQEPTLEITSVSVSKAEYAINEAATVTMEFTNPDYLKIESINVSGTPVSVSDGDQIDNAVNGTSTVSISFNAPSTSTDVNPTLGTIKGFTYNDAVASQTVTFDVTSEIPLMVSLIYVPISTATELQAIETSATSQKADPNAVYRLMNDITWDGVTSFVPITGFAATFDGQGHLITGYNSTTNGLFADTTSTAVIQDTYVDGVLNTTGDAKGLLVGTNLGTINDSSTSGTITNTEGSNVGGLAGVSSGSITGCNSDASISINVALDGYSYGGLVGLLQGSVTDSYATGAVNSQQWNSGGLVGTLDGGVVTSSHATGNVNGSGWNMGGLVGSALSGSISDCYATGSVTNVEIGSVGGLVGYSAATISNSYATGNVSGVSYVGGLVGQGLSTITNSYATGGVTATGDEVGGLVGLLNNGAISNSYATGNVTTTGGNVAGLVGNMTSGTITNCYATGNVNGVGEVKGLVGIINTGSTVTNSYAYANQIVNGVTVESDPSSAGTGATPENVATLANLEDSVWQEGILGAGFMYQDGFYPKVLDSGALEEIPNQELTLVENTKLLTSVTLDNSSYAINDTVTVTLVFNNPNILSIDSIKVSGEDYAKTSQDENGNGTSTVKTTITAPGTSSKTALLGQVEGFTCSNGSITQAITLNEPIDLSAEVYIPISNEDQLQAVDGHAQSGDPNAVFKVMNDITMSTITDFDSIDNFGATFDGQNFTISGYKSSQNGLFVSNSGTIQNVNIVGDVDATTSSVGLLVGTNTGTITNCSASGTANSTINWVGLLVGHNTGTILDSSSAGEVTSDFQVIGGLVGYNQGGSVYNSYSTANVTASQYTGGLVGYSDGTGTISSCYATGDVSSMVNTTAGGLIAWTADTTITNCYATGDVYSAGGYAGGLVGVMNSGSISYSYATGNLSGGAAELKGCVGNFFGGTITNCYAYENQVVNEATVGSNNALAGTGITPSVANYANLTDIGWQTGVLGTGFEYTAGSYPLAFKQGTTEKVPGQISIPMNVFEITNEQELQAVEFHTQKNNSSFTFKVMNDINCSSITDFNSIETFGATFDGQNYLITGFTSAQNGLFGKTEATSVIKNVDITGNVNTTGIYNTGILVGWNCGTIQNCSSSGSITGTVNTVGGLVGYNETGLIEGSHSDATINGYAYSGGLVGYNNTNATINNSYSTGTVTNTGPNTGGLAGWNAGTITNSHATGAVSGGESTGGLVGYNTGGTISNSFATGTVTGSGLFVGGLAGYNLNGGTISDSYATGIVNSSQHAVAGLVGRNDSTITNCYATGSVTGTMNTVGGLVGRNDGTLTNSYATGTVTGGADSTGGLVGFACLGSISNCYATGNVTGSVNTGGLVGYYENGTITNSYATGNVTSGGAVGGLVGYGSSSSNITNSWAYEYQKVNNVLVGGNHSLAGTGASNNVALYENLLDTAWIQPILGTSFEYSAGNHPHVLGTTGTVIPGQDTWIPIESTVIEITNQAELQSVDQHAQANNPDAIFRVINPITLTGEFNPIDSFGAIFDGQGNTISGYYSSVNGLFGYTTSTAVINDIHINGSLNVNTTDNVGILAGNNAGTIQNCSSTGSINGTFNTAGGLVGYHISGLVTDSNSSASVSSTVSSYVGGLIGYNSGSVTNTFATGAVSGVNNVGGLVGLNTGVGGNISNSYATGNVTAIGNNAGGLIGITYEGSISSVYATGNVDAYHLAGGLIGQMSSGSVSGSYATGNVTSDNWAAGSIAYVVAGSVTGSYATGNVTALPNYSKGFIAQIDPAATVNSSCAYESQNINGTLVRTDPNLAGTGPIAVNNFAYYSHISDPNWTTNVIGSGFTATTTSYPHVNYSGTSTPLPNQPVVPLKPAMVKDSDVQVPEANETVQEDAELSTDEAITDEQITNEEEPNSDSTSTSTTKEEAPADESTESTESTESQDDMEATDEEEAGATEEIFSPSLFEERIFNLKKTS